MYTAHPAGSESKDNTVKIVRIIATHGMKKKS